MSVPILLPKISVLKYPQNLNGPISSCLLKNLTPSIIHSSRSYPGGVLFLDLYLIFLILSFGNLLGHHKPLEWSASSQSVHKTLSSSCDEPLAPSSCQILCCYPHLLPAVSSLNTLSIFLVLLLDVVRIRAFFCTLINHYILTLNSPWKLLFESWN